MNDIYQSPKAELGASESSDEYGSVDKAIIGDYTFSIGDTISEAWTKTTGCKLTIHLALAAYMLVVFAVAIPLGFVAGMSGATSSPILFNLVTQLAIMAVSMPIYGGIFIIGIKHSMGRPISVGEVMGHFGKTLPLLLTVILMYIMVMLGFVLLILPGIYLMLAYYFAIPLVIDKGMGPWQALETSRKAISKRWFAFLGFGICIMLINFIGMIPLGIGLIWTIPMTMVGYGIIYRNMFGLDIPS